MHTGQRSLELFGQLRLLRKIGLVTSGGPALTPGGEVVLDLLNQTAQQAGQ